MRRRIAGRKASRPWRTTVCDPTAARAPDLVERNFSASRPDELWVCDFTYGRCWEGVVYFAFVKDAYSRMIVGWQFAPHMRTELVLDALEMALWARAAPSASWSTIQTAEANTRASTTPSDSQTPAPRHR